MLLPNVENTVNINCSKIKRNAMEIRNLRKGLSNNINTKDLNVSGDANIDGKLTVDGLIDPTGITLNDQVNNPGIISPNTGTIWTKMGIPDTLMFTDNSGTDHDLVNVGDVNGPVSSTDNAIVRFDGTNGKIIKDSSLTLINGNIRKNGIDYIHEKGGSSNFAAGSAALSSIISSGDNNTALGRNALMNATTADQNTAVGSNALSNILSGQNNIALGNTAGNTFNGTESNNIIIGNSATTGINDTTIIGNTQNRCFIMGISGIAVVGASTVFITPSGQLGSILSSIKYKENIKNLDEKDVEKLMKLNPVSFKYKKDPSVEQFGLIAEDVEKIEPKLVSYKDGEVETVNYHLLHAFYIKALQLQELKIKKLTEELEEIKKLISK